MRHQLIFVASSILFLTSAAEASPECDRMLAAGFQAGDLVVSGLRALSDSTQPQPLTQRQALTMTYIAPPNQFETGALLIKMRHIIGHGDNPQPAASVNLERPSYRSACTNSQQQFYAHTVPAATYEDYHLYGQLDLERNATQNLDALHADLRKTPWISAFGLSVSKCLRTNDPAIRFHMSFDEERRQINFIEHVSHIASGAAHQLQPVSSSIAQPGSPSTQLTARVQPFTRDSGKPACVGISVSRPAGATNTKLMVIEADNAFAVVIDPQKSWNIEWSPGRTRRPAAN